MRELGVDLSGRVPHRLELADAEWADLVVTMGCGDACPVIPGKRYTDWELEDPAGKGLAATRAIRDEIAARIERLLDAARHGRAGAARAGQAGCGVLEGEIRETDVGIDRDETLQGPQRRDPCAGGAHDGLDRGHDLRAGRRRRG